MKTLSRIDISSTLQNTVLPEKSEVDFKSKLESLTKQELIIAQAACEGETNPEIAEEHHISVLTVKKHRQNIQRKMGLTGRDAFRQFLKCFKSYLKILLLVVLTNV